MLLKQLYIGLNKSKCANKWKHLWVEPAFKLIISATHRSTFDDSITLKRCISTCLGTRDGSVALVPPQGRGMATGGQPCLEG